MKAGEFDAEAKAAFVLAYERTGEKKAAAAAVGVSRVTVYTHLAKDSEFREECERARGRLYGLIVEKLKHLAIEGVEKTTYDKDGNVVAVTRTYEPRLMLAWLKRLEREKWGDQVKVDQNVRGQIDVKETRVRVEDLTPDQRRAARDFLSTLPDRN